MLGFKILVDGVFSSEQIVINYRNEQKHYSDEATQLIDTIWIRSMSAGIRLFDGKLFEVTSHNLANRILHLELQNTSYKIFVGARDKEFVSKFGPKMKANPLSVGAVVVTVDGRFIVGKRKSDLYFNRGKYGIIAGIMDREMDLKNGIPDPFGAIMRELREEKGVDEKKVREIECLGLIENTDYDQTYMPFCIKLGIPLSILEKSVPKEHEFEKFIYVEAEPNCVSRFIAENCGNISETCLGNILLFGKKTFGKAWIDKTLASLNASSRSTKES